MCISSKSMKYSTIETVPQYPLREVIIEEISSTILSCYWDIYWISITNSIFQDIHFSFLLVQGISAETGPRYPWSNLWPPDEITLLFRALLNFFLGSSPFWWTLQRGVSAIFSILIFRCAFSYMWVTRFRVSYCILIFSIKKTFFFTLITIFKVKWRVYLF